MDQYQKFREMGYSDAEIQEAVKEIEQENNSLQSSYARTQANTQPVQSSNTLVTGQMNQDNLIKWQLELDSILERIEHILRGDKPTMINGNMVFVSPNKEEDKIFNDYGVAEIMRILTMYLNRNTIL